MPHGVPQVPTFQPYLRKIQSIVHDIRTTPITAVRCGRRRAPPTGPPPPHATSLSFRAPNAAYRPGGATGRCARGAASSRLQPPLPFFSLPPT